MRFTVQRETLLKPLSQVAGVVERRQTMPVLANILVQVTEGQVSLTGTDLEVEMVSRCAAEKTEAGEVTIPARKLFDIVRALPDGSKIEFKQSGDRVTLSAGRSKFTLSTLPANEFPVNDNIEVLERIVIAESRMRELIDRTGFAMAQQDVRYYLNGLLFDLRETTLRCVATDGHRLALCETALETGRGKRQVIVPRKGVLELQRLLDQGDSEVELEIGRSHIRLRKPEVSFTSKLIDGRFPDYEAVIPIGADKIVLADREAVRACLQRAAILSNEKYRGVKVEVAPNLLKIVAHNPEQEEATEELEVKTTVDNLNVGFNVNYFMDALASLRGENVQICLRDGNSSCLLRDADDERARHVIMPLRL